MRGVTTGGPLNIEWQRSTHALPLIVWSARPDGTVDFVNRRFEEATGVSSQVLYRDGWQTLVHPDDLPAAQAALSRAIESGTRYNIDVRIRYFDNAYRWVRAEAEPLREESGAIVRWLGTVADINDVRDANDRLSALGEALPVIVWTADASGAIDWYNRRWYEFTGQTPDEALGWGWQAAHHPEDFLEVMKRWPHSIATGEPFEMEYRLRRHDGVFNWFLARVEPVRGLNGDVVRWYGSLVDVQAQKEALHRTKRVAETLQDVFLPKQFPRRENLRIDAQYLAAERDALVGGDWYDAFELPDGTIVVSIGDVAGHGLHASVTVGRLRQAILTLAFRIEDPARLLDEVDRILQYQQPETMVTAIVGFIDPGMANVRYACAGHPPPVLATREAGARLLPVDGMPLGIGFESRRTVHDIPIAPDTVIAFYTDGITEFARDASTAEQRLLAAVGLLVGNTTITHPAEAVQELVFNDAAPADDAALMILQFSNVPQHPSAAHLQLERVWRFHSSDAHTVHAARREIGEYLRGIADTHEETYTSELIVGELLANTVEHAPGIVEVMIDWSSASPMLIVRDIGPGLHNPLPALPIDSYDESGRGLFLIYALASDVSVRALAGYGTEIRATLPVRRRQMARAAQ